MTKDKDIFDTSTIIKLVLGGLILVFGIIFATCSFTTVGADEIVIKQNFLDGQLQVWDTPGVHFKNFGKTTIYKKSSQYWFSKHDKEGKATDDAIKVRFNDGGHGSISGSMRYTLPLDHQKMTHLHMTYGSMQNIDHELVRQVVNKSVYMTGPLLSSRESYAEKRNDLINFISDQILHGVYKTEHKQTKITDPITGQEKMVDYVEPKVGQGPNGVEREEESPIEKFGMTGYNITINSVDYDETVEQQIKSQQAALMAVQQAMVNAKKAEQDILTTTKQGEAEAMKNRWTQEAIKATELTKAQQEKDIAVLQASKIKEVAALDLETAKLSAQTTITTAKADAEAKKLAINADNALSLRLSVYKEIAIAQAQAIGAQRQVPDIQIGGGSSNNSINLMEMMAIKAAKDLQLKQ